ncbi:MAG: sensor histidine kinase [Candidatus Dormibacteraceae bacterium]
MRTPRLTLASQIFLLQLGVLAIAAVAGVATSVWVAWQQIDSRYTQRALAIAEAVAATPAVSEAMLAPDPPQVLQPLATSVQRATHATFVVILNRQGVRYSHPDPTLIGKRVTDMGPGLDGKTWTGHDNDTLGPSVWAKAPIFGADRSVIGVVSVGFTETLVGASLTDALPATAIVLGSALALAFLGSVLLAGHLKRRTFGMEPEAIATMFEQREAILHGIREGTVATDLRGRLTVVNDEARDLLELGAGCVGKPVGEVLPPGRVRDMLTGGAATTDEVVLVGDRVLVANRMPVVARRANIGYVVTLRDRTQLMGVLRELDSVRSLSDALRAQAHEFSNRLHTIAGLIELGRHEEALRLITEETSMQQALLEKLVMRVGSPVLSALLLGKSVVANERGVEFRLSDDTLLMHDVGDPRDLVTVIGNLCDNALDAVAVQPAGQRWVDVSARIERGVIIVRVHDSGPGIDSALGDTIFDEGVSSKSDGCDVPRGLGLALVRQVVRRHGGTVSVENDGGAVFTARLLLPDTASAVQPWVDDGTGATAGIRATVDADSPPEPVEAIAR